MARSSRGKQSPPGKQQELERSRNEQSGSNEADSLQDLALTYRDIARNYRDNSSIQVAALMESLQHTGENKALPEELAPVLVPVLAFSIDIIIDQMLKVAGSNRIQRSSHDATVAGSEQTAATVPATAHVTQVTHIRAIPPYTPGSTVGARTHPFDDTCTGSSSDGKSKNFEEKFFQSQSKKKSLTGGEIQQVAATALEELLKQGGHTPNFGNSLRRTFLTKSNDH